MTGQRSPRRRSRENPASSSRKQREAEEAEEWLNAEFDSLSVDEIRTKYRHLRTL